MRSCLDDDDREMTILVALCTCPDEATAQQVAEAVVEGRHAACVNIVPRVVSVYRWQDQIECDDEVLLIIKTTEDAWPQLEQALVAAHPYELPEIIAVPVESGLQGYLDWVRAETAPGRLK